jgi:hypothetical protein
MKQNLPHKLVAAAWMRILLTFSVYYISDASHHHDRDFTLLLEMWQKLRIQILYNSFPRFSPNRYVLIYTHCWELRKSIDSHGRLWLLFVLKVIVWCFVTLVRICLHSLSCYLPNCCHGDFSAISHGRLWLLFVLKVIVWCFVTLVRICLHSLSCYLPNCCHGDFSAIS